MTLDEIGQGHGVTRERIRQIEAKTMSKLRHPSRAEALRDISELGVLTYQCPSERHRAAGRSAHLHVHLESTVRPATWRELLFIRGG
ncbi:hypothetical protein GCM10020219_091160 [Nonomuraea dietziae]